MTGDFLAADIVRDIREYAQHAWRTGAFRQAGIGQGKLEVQPDIRSDQVLWLEPAQCDGAVAAYFAALECLRQTINRELYLGLFDYEAHLAIYAPGSFYKKHLDQFRGSNLRTVTTTFYLNADWQPQHGGQLRLYTHSEDPARQLDVLPAAGTLVTFLSGEYYHEVLPATRERLSLTGWFRRREMASTV